MHREELPVPLPWEDAGVKEFLRLLLSRPSHVGKGNLYQQHERRGERGKMTTEREFEK